MFNRSKGSGKQQTREEQHAKSLRSATDAGDDDDDGNSNGKAAKPKQRRSVENMVAHIVHFFRNALSRIIHFVRTNYRLGQVETLRNDNTTTGGVQQCAPTTLAEYGMRLALIIGVLLWIISLCLAYTVKFYPTKDPCEVGILLKMEVQRGVLELFRAEKTVSATMPKVIHHQWKNEEIPPRYQPYYDAWLRLFPEPEFKHILWTDESARNLIKNDFDWFLAIYDGYRFESQRADSVRYFILYSHGGIYADLGYEPLENFWFSLPKNKVGIVESPYQYNEKVQNSLMSSPIGDEFWKDVFEVLKEKVGSPVLSPRGPVMLDVLMKRTKREYTILPCELYHRIPLGEMDKSPLITLLHRETLGRFYPMRYCGDFRDKQCHFGRHHNTAAYLSETGV